MLAQALFSSLGVGGVAALPDVAALCTAEESERLQRGYAMRLGQRLSGGVAAGLERSRLLRKDGCRASSC